ncbi:hypothetical protein Dda_2247 [Drechslerella dactyloides]|uniref:Rhodopsin domain-containing protein n=1 Tax=Drechslerella dactyloides TaxID=74499 RepID=A0AAD6NNR3_DREDA|nr:hypothetical protein Dda_2247 [Drechslerella dactyloides]
MPDELTRYSLLVCYPLSLVLLFLRLGLRRWRKERWNHGDSWSLVAMLLLLTRLITVNITLTFGSIISPSIEQFRNRELTLTQDALDKIVIGSQMNIAGRIILVSLLWALKFMVFDFLWRIIRKLPYERPITITYLASLVSTWLAALIVIFVECRPFNKNWQISPDPGQCVQGNAWLITYEIGNLITDLMLLALPFPLLFMARVPWKKRIRLCAVFSLGFFLVATCIIRMIQGLTHGQFQPLRGMWASIEVLIATVVACGPSMYCTLRRGRDRNTVTSGSTTLRGTRPAGSPVGSGMGSASYPFGDDKESLPNTPAGSRIGLTRNINNSNNTGSGYYQPRPRPTSNWSGASNERHRKMSVASRELSAGSRHSSISSRNSRPDSPQGSMAGFNLDISTLGGDIAMAGTEALAQGVHRGSVISSVWTDSEGRDLESIGEGIDLDEKHTEQQEGEEEEFERFWIIDEERDTGTGDLADIVVETTWTQFRETTDGAVDPERGLPDRSDSPIEMVHSVSMLMGPVPREF